MLQQGPLCRAQVYQKEDEPCQGACCCVNAPLCPTKATWDGLKSAPPFHITHLGWGRSGSQFSSFAFLSKAGQRGLSMAHAAQFAIKMLR